MFVLLALHLKLTSITYVGWCIMELSRWVAATIKALLMLNAPSLAQSRDFPVAKHLQSLYSIRLMPDVTCVSLAA